MDAIGARKTELEYLALLLLESALNSAAEDPEGTRIFIRKLIKNLGVLTRIEAEAAPADVPLQEAAAPTKPPIKSNVEELPRSRVTMIQDLAILEAIKEEPKAASIDTIIRRLEDIGLAAPEKRAAVVSKLNRLRAKELLYWRLGTKGTDIVVTEAGQHYAAELRNRLLRDDELNVLRV